MEILWFWLNTKKVNTSHVAHQSIPQSFTNISPSRPGPGAEIALESLVSVSTGLLIYLKCYSSDVFSSVDLLMCATINCDCDLAPETSYLSSWNMVKTKVSSDGFALKMRIWFLEVVTNNIKAVPIRYVSLFSPLFLFPFIYLSSSFVIAEEVGQCPPVPPYFCIFISC